VNVEKATEIECLLCFSIFVSSSSIFWNCCHKKVKVQQFLQVYS